MFKYLHIVHTIKPGGINQFVTSIVKLNNFSETLHEVAIFSQPKISTDLKLIDISDCRKNPIEAYKTAKNFANEYDKIFIHTADYLLSIMFGFFNGSYYMFQHGMAVNNGFLLKRLAKKFWFSLIPTWINAKVVFSTEFAIKKAKKSGIKIQSSRVKIVPFGTSIERKRTTKHKSNKIELVIGSAGRLVSSKRFDQLILGLKEYSGGMNIRLDIAGEGPEKCKLRNLVSKIKNKGIRINFLGQIDSMKDFYDNIDLFVFPSKNESFGLVVLEALFRNVPVLVPYDVGGCLNLLKDNQFGFIVENIREELSTKLHAIETNNEILTELSMNILGADFSDYSIKGTKILLEGNI